MSDFENSLKLAESGNPIEQFRVGIHYYYGTSVTKDLKKAVKWFKASAEQGYIYAETSLGICYRKGEGILTNYIEAVKLFQHAAALGDIVAIYNLALCYYYGQGVIKDYQKSAELFRQASEYGNVGETHRWSHIISIVPYEPSTLDEALIVIRKSLATTESLNIQLGKKIFDSNQNIFDNDIKLQRIAELEKELSKIKKILAQVNGNIAKLRKEKDEQKHTYEHSVGKLKYTSIENENKLKKSIDELEKQLVTQQSQIEGLISQVKIGEDTLVIRNKEIAKQNSKICTLDSNITSLNSQLKDASNIIAIRDKSIKELNEQITMLKTQRPFVRKANVLKAVDFFSLLSLVILLLPGLIYRGMIMYNMIFVILVMGGVRQFGAGYIAGGNPVW
ncbi:MAG TPA: SEL1-like repeat protein [Candidatus Fimousia stercorigallinarum]|nr:SEL1-like repeat protein [Candidatus Fimousia stercorigallinarum]